MANVNFGVSVDEQLYQKFEEVRRKAGYSKRSHAIQEAMRLFIAEKSKAIIVERGGEVEA